MFYKTEVKDHIRVTPELFALPIEEAVAKKIREKFEGHVSQELGIVIDVLNVKEVGEGSILPGDGSYFYDTDFELLVYKPELHEVIYGKIKDIADFGAFMTIGPIEAMVHVSQSMDDYVSFSKDKVLVGRETKRTLKIGDLCKARVVAISMKDPASPKINLTMRQPGLGKIEWIAEDFQKEEKKLEKKPAKKGKDKEKK